nr:hypothetical protein [Tanacetum cinerariifolium]
MFTESDPSKWNQQKVIMVVANLVVVVKACIQYVGDLGLRSMEDEEVVMVDGVFKGAFRALGLKMKALVDAMEVYGG